MKKSLLLLLIIFTANISAQIITVKSPDSKIVVTINNTEKLIYSVSYNGKQL